MIPYYVIHIKLKPYYVIGKDMKENFIICETYFNAIFYKCQENAIARQLGPDFLNKWFYSPSGLKIIKVTISKIDFFVWAEIL